MDITRWPTPKSDWFYSLQPKLETLYTVIKNKIRSWLWLRSWTLAKVRLKLKKVGKPTKPFRYDLNQIPYDYTVEVRNKFKGLDLIGRRQWYSTPVLLPGKSHGWRSLVGCSPWGQEESDTTSLSLFTFMHWRRKWQTTPMFLPGESQGWWSLVGCRLWGRTESDTTEVT